MRKFLTLSVVALLCSLQVWAQRTITGRVTDDKGTPIANVSIQVKGTNTGTVTNSDGTYSLVVPANGQTLVISAVDMGTQELAIGNQSTINVSLQATERSLQEVVVVGYGTQKRADLTGSVGTIKGGDIENRPFPTIDRALQGQVAGLQSVSASGAPGTNTQIRIRGVSSINASNQPLWVIDGVPVNTGDASRLSTSSNLLSTLNPNDIESITVLKDAASASIYGSRAANGVIVVTTKKGRAGKTRFRFDTEVGMSDIAYENDKYKPLNAEQWFTITREGLINAGIATAANVDAIMTANFGYGNGIDYNWYDAVKQTGTQQQYNLSASGGNERTTFYLSGGYFRQEGSVINTNMDRYNGSFRVTNKATNRLTLNANLNGGFTRQRTPLNGGAFGNPVLTSYFLLPSRSAYTADGSYNFASLGGLHNTVALTEMDRRSLKQLSFRGNLSGEYTILEGLRFKSSFGGDFNTLEEDQYNNPLHGDGAASNGRAFAYYTRYFNYVWTNTLDFQRHLTQSGDLTLNAQVGYEAQMSRGYLSSVQSQNFPANLTMQYPSVGATPITASASTTDYALTSGFSTANLNLRDKYILSGSFRRDGSSRFGANTKYGNFWSVGASWNVDNEDFMQSINVVSQLKLRASYGVNGNAGIGNYDWLPQYGYGFNYNQSPGSAPTVIGDSSLTWELNKPFNVGIDVGFLKNRITVSADYYQRKSEDLLLSFPLSRTTGFNTVTRNFGALENKGIEVTLNAIPIQAKDFNWAIDFNFAHNKNKVTRLPSDILNGTQNIREGYDVQTYYLRQFAGVDPENGNPLWYADPSKDQATTNTYTSSIRQMKYSAAPKYFGSLTNTFTLKGFTLDAQLYYNFGNYVYDSWGSYYVGAGFGASFNKVARVLDRWQNPGDQTDIPRYVYNGNRNFNQASTFYLNKGDFIRLRNVQLGYTLPSAMTSRLNLSNVFFYVRGTNLATWVKDENLPFDPEQGSTSATNLEVFIPKTLTVGLNLGF